MRTNEAERLKYLLQKKQRGEPLTEKEIERINSLLLQARQEREKKEEKQNAGTLDNGTAGTSRAAGISNDPGTSAGNSGETNSKSRPNGGTDGEPAIFDAGETDRSSGRAGGQINSGGRSIRDSIGSDGTESGTDQRSRGRNQGSYRTDTDGEIGDRGSESGSGDSRTPGEAGRLSDLIPNPEVTPRRKAGKKPTSKKAVGGGTDTDTLSALLMAGFSLIASVTSRPHWVITEDEAEKIASPMETIFADIPAKQKKIIEKYTAPMVLSAAVASVVIPRVMIDIETKKGSANRGANKRPLEPNGTSPIANPIERSDSERPNNSRAPQNDIPVIDSKIAGLFGTGDNGFIGG